MPQLALRNDSIIAQVNDVVAAEVGSETMMMRIENGMYYGLDDTATRIWQLLAQPRSVSQIIDILLTEYEVEPAQCKQQTLDFLNDLFKEGLISIA